MPFDIVLPSLISFVIIVIVFLHERFETKLKSLFEEKEFRIRDAVFLVIAMGVMVTIIALVAQQAQQIIQVLFLAAYSFVLFLFTYTAVEKWYLALVPPVLFVALYLYAWNLIFLNAFALLFAIFISVYLGSLFSWTTMLVFAGLITVMDVIQVFGTKFMGTSADELVRLQLPILIEVPTFPLKSAIRLGLGDIFLAGLLAIQTAQKYDRKAGIVAAISTGFAFLVFEFLVINLKYSDYFPATLVVIAGWLLGLAIYNLFKRIRSS